MSMDDQYREMINFRQSLIDFNERLKASMRSLEAQHEYVSPLWDDEMRRHYDAQWEPLRTTMKYYIEMEGRDYVEFLSMKLYKLEKYLYGNY